MQHKHLLNVIRDDFTTVLVTFEDLDINHPSFDSLMAGEFEGDEYVQLTPPPQVQAPWQPGQPAAPQAPKGYPKPARQALRVYTYKVKRDVDIGMGTKVVVHTERQGFTVGTVVTRHPEPKLDLDSGINYKWIVDVVDMGPYRKLLQEERTFMELAMQAEREHQRAAVLSKMTDHLPEGSVGRKMFEEAVAKFRSGQLTIEAQANTINKQG